MEPNSGSAIDLKRAEAKILPRPFYAHRDFSKAGAKKLAIDYEVLRR